MRKLIIFLIIAVLAGIGIGYYFYSKPVPSLADETPVAVLTADELCQEYQEDETAANTSYLDKVIELSGTVSSIMQDTSGTVLFLGTESGFYSVSCKLEPGMEPLPGTKEGSRVRLKGMVNGLNLVDVNMNRCVPMQAN